MQAPTWRAVSPALAELAAAHGVATQYWDQSGRHVQVGAAVVEAVLAALGVECSDDAEIAAALHDRELRDWRRMLPPIYVLRSGDEGRLWMHVPDGDPAQVEVELEDGTRHALEQLDHWVAPRDVDGVLVGEASFRLAADLPLGWHRLHARSGARTADSWLVVTPRRLDPNAIIGARQWGFMMQLYATRSTASWGLGDAHDLAEVARWSARDLGAGFTLVNPLHAASPLPPMAASPYLPVTRRFANPIYIHIEDLPEYAALPDAVRRRVDELGSVMAERNETADLLDRDAVWAAKRTALEVIASFGMSQKRRDAFDAYCRREGQGLDDFATWCALVEVHGAQGGDWPAGLGDPRSAQTAQFRRTHAAQVDFHQWLQFVITEQLVAAQRAARDAGMPVGVIHDLAVGVHPEGADAWSLQHVLARNVGVGAPPDMYNQLGQNWHQPPWRPEALAEAAFMPYRDLLRSVLAYAGGLRIDHVLGLFRMWWIPAGMPATSGTYVRFDHDAMLGILMLEAQRAGAVIIGEDLGTVEPWVRDVLVDRGLLGTTVLWFECDDDGAIRPPERWRREVLASVTVHDLPPTAGYLADEHVRIRHELGLLDQHVDEVRAAALRERQEWVAILTDRGWLAPGTDLATPQGREAMAVALHRAAAVSPARLLGVGLPDVVGDRRAQNQPGTDQEYPNWRVPMTDGDGRPVLLDDLERRPATMERILAAVGARTPGRLAP